MTPARWQQVKQLFDAAVSRSPQERARFLDKACVSDETLRREVEILLESDGRVASFMDTSAIKQVAEAIARAAPQQAAGSLLKHYKIISLLGAGGMGEVYLAEDVRLGRQVALKVLPESIFGEGDARLRFAQEARAASLLNHPHIVTIYDVSLHSEKDEPSFIAMEYVVGESLAERMKRASLAASEITDIAAQIADALDAAHQAGIIHRDIKPSNIMLTERGQVKILDFGLAKLTTNAASVSSDIVTLPQTATGMILGTVAYMSPEQALGQKMDARTDIFSIGVVLYEMLTGRRPFDSDTATKTIVAIAHSQPAAIARFNYDAPPELERITRKCLEKDKERRYQTARDLFIDLQNLRREMESSLDFSRAPGPVISDEAATTKTVTLDGRQKTIVAPRTLLIGLSSVIVLAIIGSIYVFWWRALSKAALSADVSSLAVLPLKMIGGDAQDEYLSDGIADELTTKLTKLKGVRIVSRSIAMRFKNSPKDAAEIGRELGVEAVLDGTVQKAGNRFRVSVHLVNAANGFELWADDGFDSDIHDLLDTQRQLAEAVASKVRVQLTTQERSLVTKDNTANVDAYELLLRGKQRYRNNELQLAQGMFERAVQLDPNFADAYAWLSLTLTEQFGAGLGDRKTLDDAIAQANKALEIDPQLIVARRALIQLYRYVSKTSEGLMQARLALATDPNDVDAIAAAAFAYFEAGMPDKSVPLYEKALNADPSNTDVRNRLARSYLYARAYQKGLDVLAPMLAQNQGGEWIAMHCYWSLKQYDKAIAMGDRLLKSDPKKTFPLVGGLDFGKLLKEVGQVERARAVWREGIASGEAQLAIIENVRTRVWVGHMYAALGERDKALEQLRRVLQLEPDSAWTLYQAGEISAFLGNKREAVDYFKQAIAHGWLEVQYFYDYPDELLGDDAEYREVRDGLQNKVDKLKAQY